MRARIALRRLGMELGQDEMNKDVEDEIHNIKKIHGEPLTVDDIITAFECGEEVSISYYPCQEVLNPNSVVN